MPTVLLAWELGGGAGHCVNLQPIAAELVARGCHVWFAARDLATARRVFADLPVRYLPAPYLVGHAALPIFPALSLAHILHNIGFGEDSQLDVLTSAWRHLMDAVKPDVLVCEHAPTALLASRRRSMRRVVIGTGFFSPPDVSPLPDLRFWMPGAPPERLVQDETAILDRVNRLLTRDGLPPLARLARLYADADANFLLTFPELDHYPQRQEAAYWGMWSLRHRRQAEWPEGMGPRIFAYLKPLAGSQDPLAMLAALRDVGLPSLVYMAAADSPRLRRYETPHLRLTSEPVDIRSVAAACDVAILNGNAGTSTELLLAGVPQLNVPLFLEQTVFSKLVAAQGAGLVANPRRPEQFGPRLRMILDGDAYRGAARRFAQRHAGFRAQASIDGIVAAILNLLPS